MCVNKSIAALFLVSLTAVLSFLQAASSQAASSQQTELQLHIRLAEQYLSERKPDLYRHAGRIADAKQELNEYLKYKKLQASLSAIFKQMRLPRSEDATGDADAGK